jgi:hypothetical protein
LFIKVVLVPFVDQLVCSSDQTEIVDVTEFFGDFISEKPSYIAVRSEIKFTSGNSRAKTDRRTSSSRAYSPGFDIFWAGPNQIAKCSFVRDFLSTSDESHLVEGPDFRAEPAVHTKHLSVDIRA